MLSSDVLKATILRKQEIVNERQQARRKVSELNTELAEIIATEDLLTEVVEREIARRELHESIYEAGKEEVRNGRPLKSTETD